MSRRMGAGAIRALVNARSLQLDCARVLHESLLLPVLAYGGRKERSRICAVQIDKFRGLLVISCAG